MSATQWAHWKTRGLSGSIERMIRFASPMSEPRFCRGPGSAERGATICCPSFPAYGVFQKPAPRKQLNIGLSEEQYNLVQAAAESETVKVTAFRRAAILDAALPVEPNVAATQFPNWLIAPLAFLCSGQRDRNRA